MVCVGNVSSGKGRAPAAEGDPRTPALQLRLKDVSVPGCSVFRNQRWETVPRDLPTHAWNRSGTEDLSGRKFIRTISGTA